MTSEDSTGRGPGVVGVAGVIGVVAAIVAAAVIWLVLTEPVTVATAVDARALGPLVRRLAEVIFAAMAGVLDYL